MAKLVHLVLLVAILQYLNFEVNGATAPSINSDCSSLQSCTECVASQSTCTWCTAAYRCTNNVPDVCRNDILVSSAKSKSSSQAGPDFCPKFTAVDNQNEILVASGTRKSIKAKIRVTGHFLLQKRFTCKFTIDGREVTANAQLLGETFTCDAIEFTTQSPKSTVKFEILWDKTKSLANPNNMHLVVYDCNKLGNSCKTCFGLQENFNCGWCKTTSKCEIASKCSGDKTSWVNRLQTCP